MISKNKMALFILAGLLFITSGCASQNSQKTEKKVGVTTEQVAAKQFKWIPAKKQKLQQIYGIGYPGNDEALYIASNTGLKLYKQTKWLETTSNQHAYIGFQAMEGGFVASGHPVKGSSLKDPLGLVQSTDQGKTLAKLAFYGKSNFHYTASSFFSNNIYVINEQTNGSYQPGVFYSNDKGKSWNRSKFEQFDAKSLGMMAAHPRNGNEMAMATRTGIYYSENSGDMMKRVTDPIMVTALTFANDELLYSSVENKQIMMKKLNPKTGAPPSVVTIPFLDYDNPVTYVAVDPKNPNKLAFSTYKNDLYESADAGKSWVNLLKNGKIEQE